MQKRLSISGLLIASIVLPLFKSLPILNSNSIEQPGHVQVVDFNSDELVLDISSSDYKIEERSFSDNDYQHLSLPGEENNQNPGEPQLPVINRLIGIPPEGDIQVIIVEDQFVSLPGNWNFKLAPYPAALDQELQAGGWRDAGTTNQPELIQTASMNTRSYSIVSVSDDAWLRNQRIVRIGIRPFEYHTSSGELFWHQKIRIKIVFPDDRSIDNNEKLVGKASDTTFDVVLQQNLINYDQAKQWRGIPESVFRDPPRINQEIDQRWNNTSQTRYRIPVQKDGLYQITYETLLQAGVITGSIEINKFALSCQGLVVDLFIVENDGDDILEAGEAILFYGEKFHGDWMAQRYTSDNQGWLTYSMQNPDGTYAAWKPSMNATMLEKYTDENVYWLSVNPLTVATEKPQEFYQSRETVRSSFEATAQFTIYLPIIRRYGQAISARHTQRTEESLRWTTLLFGSEETWYWEEIQTSSPVIRSYPTTLDNIATGVYTATLRGEIVAKNGVDGAGPDHHIRVYINDTSHTTPLIDATWDGKSRYRFEAQFPQSRLVNGENLLEIEVLPTPASSLQDLFFDWFEIDYQRNLVAVNDQLLFQADNPGAWGYQVTGFSTNQIKAFDISDPNHPQNISSLTIGSGTLTFVREGGAGAKLVAGVPWNISTSVLSAYTSPDFTSPADYLIITHPAFIAGAQELANYRAAQGLTAKVININDLYNEFNDGIFSPLAIKNFLRFAFENWPTPPSFVVLIGDGHWNYKNSPAYDTPTNFIPPFLAWVDPWQGEVDSANQIAMIVGNDPLPDVHIARIPVNTTTELAAVIAKITAYEQAVAQEWQKHWLFVADNTPDSAGNFVALSESIIADYLPANGTADRVYLDDFTDVTGGCGIPSGSRTCPAATQALINDLNSTGALLVNYSGHGSIDFWAGEQIFVNADIPLLSNGSKLPVVFSLTCLDGYWIHPSLSGDNLTRPGLAEDILRASQKGAVATFSPTGLGVATGHDSLQRGFYDALFINGEKLLGPATLSGKVRLYNTGFNLDLLQTFTIFGDPALEIQVPASP